MFRVKCSKRNNIRISTLGQRNSISCEDARDNFNFSPHHQYCITENTLLMASVIGLQRGNNTTHIELCMDGNKLKE